MSHQWINIAAQVLQYFFLLNAQENAQENTQENTPIQDQSFSPSLINKPSVSHINDQVLGCL